MKFVTNVAKKELSVIGPVQVVTRIRTPEDGIMAEGDFMLDAKGPWVTKLLAMRKKYDGGSILTLGEYADGAGYLSKAQLAENLLAK